MGLEEKEHERRARWSGACTAVAFLLGYTAVSVWYRLSRENPEQIPTLSILFLLFAGFALAPLLGGYSHRNHGWIGVPRLLLMFVVAACATLLGIVVG